VDGARHLAQEVVAGAVAGARARFGEVSSDLAGAIDGATITVGLTEYAPDDTLDVLVRRADAAMMDLRG
jgi:hypothetical protein